MDEFEYSVEISDGDWECFFAECEACNMLPPPLAHVDDSEMSDFDDTRAVLAKRAQKVEQTVAPGENNGPTDCGGSPVERFLGKHAIGGLESLLSGSEEDIHQQSVNMFFESLKNVTEPERFARPRQVTTVINRGTVVEKEQCRDGQKPKSRTLPINIPMFNSLRDSGDSNRNTMKEAERGCNISPEPAGYSVINSSTNTSVYSEIELDIREDSTETSPADKGMEVQVCTPLKDAGQKHSLTSPLSFGSKCNTKSPRATETLTNVKWKEEQTPLFQFDSMSVSKSASQELSPSASFKRKRRKKRRLSFEQPENSHGGERRVLVRPSDSEEEQYKGRGGASPSLSDKMNFSSLYSAPSNLPVRTSAGIKAKDLRLTVPSRDHQYTYVPENTLRQDRCNATSSAENNAPYTSLSASYDNVMSAVNHSGNVVTSLRPCVTSQEEELTRLNKHAWLPVSVTGSVTGESDQYRKSVNGSANGKIKHTCADSFNESNKITQTTAGCENLTHLTCSAKVKSVTESHDSALGDSQNDRLSDAKSVLAAEAGNSVRDNHTLCQSETEPRQQLEINQFSSTPDKTPALNTNLQSCDVRTEVTPSEVSPPMAFKNICASGKMGSTQREITMSTFGDFSPSDRTRGSSCCTEHTKPVKSLSNEMITDVVPSSFCPSGSQREQKPHIREVDVKPEPGSQSTESKPGLLCEAEDDVTTSKAEREAKNSPDSNHSVFAMSSFWNEMEKLTINDILGLRMISEAAPPFHLPPLQENQEADMFVTNESDSLVQLDPECETKPIPKNGHVSAPHTVDSSSSKSVMWMNEHVPVSVGTDIYPQNISEQAFNESAQKTLRKIPKNTSVHNLYALKSEAFTSTWTGQIVQTFAKGESEKEQIPKKEIDMDSSPSCVEDSYRISVSNIFQYFFGGKQSNPRQSVSDDISAFYTGGNSVSETYDHFFSDFDTENLFTPLITAEDQTKHEQGPVSSYSCSATRNLQFPEVYDSLFASSSSDDSSESGEEDENRSPPVRVVSRFSRKPSSSQICTDMYEDFFTDSDLRQNFFWNTTLSFRNITFSGSKVQKQTPSNSLSCMPLRQSHRAPGGTVTTTNAGGDQNMIFADPLLCHLEDRTSRQQVQEPFRYDDSQEALVNPRLDTALLPLQQSDMCLVCIAFASWVLKTANPQVGDAWKAVLLANVSALSAIRYLRKYVKIKAALSEKRLHHTSPPDS